LLQEIIEKTKKHYKVQVFATDIDSNAISIARRGVYPASIEANLTQERISNFFTLDTKNNTYRVKKTLRDTLVFSEQNLLKDPPFSKIDFISCRNLLIYLKNDIQKNLIPLFHYSLNSNGILLLGTSETIGNFESIFNVIDRKNKIYQRKENVYDFPLSKQNSTKLSSMKEELIMKKQEINTTSISENSLRMVMEQSILNESMVAGVIIDGHGDVFYFHGRTGLYLEPSPGEAGINNVLKMAREGLKQVLSTSLQAIVKNKRAIRIAGLNVKTNSHYTKVNLTIKVISQNLLPQESKELYVILLHEENMQGKITIATSKKSTRKIEKDSQIEELKAELRIKEENLQTLSEELESSIEELRSSNEELQSVNEELQSTNEELETSKEELQSINEELSTVNTELESKLNDLSMVNNDMSNMLAATNIAIIFLDCELNIIRFTPETKKIVNLISSDVGRPLGNIVSNLINYNCLIEDAQAVLETLIPKNLQVQTNEGKWYKMIIQPYRTSENIIDGIVLTFIDIDEAKRAKDHLTVSEIGYRTLFETSNDGIIVLDGNTGEIQDVNPFLIKLLGISKKELIKKKIWDIGNFEGIIENKNKFIEMQSQKKNRYEGLILESSDGAKITVEFVSNVYVINNVNKIQCNIRINK